MDIYVSTSLKLIYVQAANASRTENFRDSIRSGDDHIELHIIPLIVNLPR